MCNHQYHNCSICGEETRCYQPNSVCPEYNGFPGQPCENCEAWDEELRRDEERVKEAKERFESEFDFNDE